MARRSASQPAPRPNAPDHQPGVTEDGLRLGQALLLDAADESLGRDVDIFQEKRGGIAGADAVLVLPLPWLRPSAPRSTTNHDGAAGGQG